jgi:hypothetical protein
MLLTQAFLPSQMESPPPKDARVPTEILKAISRQAAIEV